MGSRAVIGLLALALGCASEPRVDAEGEGELPRGGENAPAAECELGPLGRSIADAAATSDPRTSLIPLERLVTYRNIAGPALVEGSEIFPTLAAMIADAELDVNIAMFEWEAGSEPSNELLGGLVALEGRLNDQRASRGGQWERDPVQVRIVVNAPTYGEAVHIEPLWRDIAALDLDERLLEVQAATRPALAFGVMHEKLAIIDGLHVHIGGANVQAYNDWSAEHPPWWDSAYVLSGAVAQSALFAFEELWSESAVWDCDHSDCFDEPAPAFERAAAVGPQDACTPMIALNRRAAGEPNNDIDNAQNAGYLAAIEGARRRIKIQTPNLNDDAVKDALVDAIARGVEVRVVLPLGFNDNFAGPLIFGQGGTNDENADELYQRVADRVDPERGCELLDIRWFSRIDDDGTVAVIDDRECETLPDDACAGGHVHGAAHAKYMSVDGEVVLVGSMNQDTQSWNNSGETNVAIDSQDATRRYDAALFDPAFEIAAPTGHCGPR